MVAELVYIILGLAILWLALMIIWDGREHAARMRMLRKREAWYQERASQKN